ncbi:MAG: SDR family NAD(P)-dependent oxidoreductase, partial [Beijerinckiaceae bacterium]
MMTTSTGGTGRRHVVITGASSGLGAALARSYANDSAKLTLIARSAERLAAVADECRANGAHQVATATVDVRDAEALSETLLSADASAPIDILIANAGLGGDRSLAGPHGEDPG